MSRPFRYAALGGTFDHFHKGHRHFLDTAFSQADFVVIGLTRDTMVRHKEYAHTIQDYSTRYQEIEHYLQTYSQRYRISPLTDLYGETLTNPQIDLLVVTTQTEAGAAAINDKRGELALEPLPLVVADLIEDETHTYISSTRIRSGHISREGKVYAQAFLRDLVLTAAQRDALRQPQGVVIPHSRQLDGEHLQTYSSIGLVGDIVTHSFIEQSLPFNLAIIDFQTRGEAYSWQLPAHIMQAQTANKAGTIQTQAINQLQSLLTTSQAILTVTGEEDLLALPLALLLPLGSVIYYGQPDTGLVELVVTEDRKQALFELITQA